MTMEPHTMNTHRINTDTITVPMSVLEHLISKAEMETLIEISPLIPLPALTQTVAAALYKLHDTPITFFSQLIFFADAFSSTELHKELDQVTYDFFFREYQKWEPLSGAGRSWEQRQFLSWAVSDGVSNFLGGLEDARVKNISYDVSYEIWECMYSENYKYSSVSVFESKEIFEELNLLMWRNMSEDYIYRLIVEEIVHCQREDEYRFIMGLAAVGLSVPAEWLMELYPQSA